MSKRIAGVWIGASIGVALLWAGHASACGAMLFPAHEAREGGMSDQLILLAPSERGTVMIVSAGYASGNTEDFVFLLPLAQAPADVKDGDPRLFEAMERNTAPRVVIEPPTADGGCGCGSASNDGAKGGDLAGGTDRGVDVYERGETATYQYVVVGGDGQASVADWLTQEGFAVPGGFQQAIDDYVARGWLFIAARLQPGANTGLLAPLELHLGPARPTELVIPIGFSAQSAPRDGPMSITLYLVTDTPAAPTSPYATVRIDPDDLEGRGEQESNYADVFDAAVAPGAFVVERVTPEWAPTELDGWIGGVEEMEPGAYDVPASVASAEGIGARLASRFDGRPVHLLRFRTALQANQLRDLPFAAGPQEEFTGVYHVVYDPPAPSEAFSGLLLVLFMAVGVGRARRRR